MKILYFAWLRENIGHSLEQVTPPKEVQTVADLVEWLSQNNRVHARAFSQRSEIRVAVDQRQAKFSDSIINAKEVAFFPPITGG